MGLFGRKENKEEEIPSAIEVLICPEAETKGEFKIEPNFLKNNLLNMIVKKDELIKLRTDMDRIWENTEFEKVFRVNREEHKETFSFRFYVLDTKPSGKVKITEDTKITYLTEFPDTEGFPKSRVLLVKELPDLKKLTELKDVEQMKKIAENNFVNKYEDDKEIIYFSTSYFFKKNKP